MLVGTCRVWRISTSGTAPLQLSNDFDTLGTGVCTGDEINLVTALAAGGPPDENGDSETVYAVTNGYGPLSGSPGGEVWVTTDAGYTLMTNVTGNVNPNGYAISSVAIDSSVASGNGAYVGIMGFSTPSYPTSHVWQTTNAGRSWTDWTGTGLPDAPVNALLVDASVTPSQIYAGTDVGVFVSLTTTASWTEVGPAPGPGVSGFLPNAPVTALQILNYEGTKTLVASTYGRGIWSYTLVAGPDFAIAVTATPNTTVVNQNVTWNGTLTALNGYTGSVALTCTAGHPGTCDISPQTVTLPPPIGLSSQFTVTLGSATVGTFNFTIQGTDGTLTRDTPPPPLTLTVTGPPPDFTWTDTGSTTVTVLAGQSASYTFSAAPVGGGTFSSAVSFACSGLPALTSGGSGAGCEFSPATIAAGAGTTPVTLTISTTGPNLGTESQPRRGGALRLAWTGGDARASMSGRPRILPFLTFAWVLLVGIVGVRRQKRGKPRLYGGIAWTCVAIGLVGLISCGGVAGGGGGGQPVTVTVSPSSVVVALGGQQQFTATVNNSSDQAVTWAVTGGSANGTISANGLYTAPAVAPSPATVTVTATSAVVGSTPGSATVQVGTAETVMVTVLPGVPTSVFPNNTGWPSQTAQFTATVTGTGNTAVTWSLTTPNGGTIDANGLYTAPTVGPDLPASVTVTAFSQADPTKSASAQETLKPATIPGTYSNIMVTATDSAAVLSDPITLTVQ
jgi:hypothetical protein